ncbi:ATP-binding protein [Phyllobacterium leguminum]|uniref:histidine kinase n=1 Tax=Phyllobacterium leguminum TaxID=314237 RepID=A0A318T1D2_9HYPH|nr:ATP-binding protein [Phyllobacterium leguminum]PYE86591.1 signal transduction histidine kinase [Phyllobacterium leguminum]
MPFRQLFSLRTIHGQITGIILVGLIIIVIGGSMLEIGGSMLEQRIGNDQPIPEVERLAERVFSISSILKDATPEERGIILRAANRAGWDISLQPREFARTFTRSSPTESTFDIAFESLFQPDGPQTPLGGWKTFVDGRRVVAAGVDGQSILVMEGVPNTVFWTVLLRRGPHYLVALITLIILFSSFAVWAITRPLRNIASAAANADITSGRVIFEEKGSVEIMAVARSLNEMSGRITNMIDGRTRMLRGVSHDLRTPLTRLRLRAERIREPDLRDMLLADIARINSLIKESLSYMRDDHHREQIERVDLATTLQTICNEFSDIGHNVVYDGPPHATAHFKPLAITRAVTNLCDNAVKFGNNVIVELRSTMETVVIEVADDGPGIPEESRLRVLEPFYKIDAARTRGDAGFGLGLSIVDEIVQAHQGRLELLDRQPSGLIARLTIPLRQ